MSTYQIITDAIVEAIEQGTGKYQMPWHTIAGCNSSPINTNSRKAYRGINTLMLGASAVKKGYASAEWGTYKQWQEKGAQVRKGEKSTTVVFWKFFDKTRETEDGETTKTGSVPMARMYSVFNAAQVEGYQAPAEPAINPDERNAVCEEFVSRLGATIHHGGNRAFYRPSEDAVTMPMFGQFTSASGYYSVLSHELTHWTGPKLERDLTGRFGSESYAMEELVAELSAAFTCSYLGIPTEPRTDHAPYIASWLKVLKGDSRAIFTAASQAQKACDWMVERAGVAIEVAA